MLIAEIHGKRFPEAETMEDWLTSAIFGSLRHINPNVFWPRLFLRALSAGEPRVSVASELSGAGVVFDSFSKLDTVFWKNCGRYGEPDVILRFTGPGVRSLMVVVEVKLNATKSGSGEKDQLARYLALLEDRTFLSDWICEEDHRFVIYLTRTYATRELSESVLFSNRPDAKRKIFGLEWRDVLEMAAAERPENMLLLEVADFLKKRGFEAFKGLREPALDSLDVLGSFYMSGYFLFAKQQIQFQELTDGRFYQHGTR